MFHSKAKYFILYLIPLSLYGSYQIKPSNFAQTSTLPGQSSTNYGFQATMVGVAESMACKTLHIYYLPFTEKVCQSLTRTQSFLDRFPILHIATGDIFCHCITRVLFPPTLVTFF